MPNEKKCVATQESGFLRRHHLFFDTSHVEPGPGIDLNLIGQYDAASLAASWIRMQQVKVLNVAGPRASEDHQIYRDVVIILEQVIQILTDEDRKTQITLKVPKKGKPSTLPKTVQEAVDRLIDELPLKDKTTIASIVEDELITLQFTLGSYIGKEFGVWSGNRPLLHSCEIVSGDKDLHPNFAPSVIVKELWKCLQETYKLRVVK